MRLFNLITLGTSLLVAGSATVQDSRAYRVKCDDYVTLRPSDSQLWKQASAVELTMNEAIDLAVEYAKKKGWEEVRPLNCEFVVGGKPAYYLSLICRRTNKKDEDIAQRWILRVGTVTKRVVRWQILHRFPLRPTRVQPTRLESGLRYCDLVPGDGPQQSCQAPRSNGEK